MNNKSNRMVFANLLWSIKELKKYSIFYLILLIGESILKGIVPVISLLLTQQMINNIQLQLKSFRYIVFLLVILTIFEAFSEICLNYIQLKLNNYELEFDTYMQSKILKKISDLDCKEFENSSTYDLISRTQYDANAGLLGNIKIFFSVVSSFISTVSYIAIMIRYSIVIFLIVILVPFIRYYFEKKYNLKEYSTIKKNTELNRKASYISYLLTNAEHFKEIKMYNLFSYFIDKYEKIKLKYNRDLIRLHNKRTTTYSILSMFEIVIDFMTTFYIIAQSFSGQILIGEFILYNNSINSIKHNMILIFSQISSIYINSSILDQIREFFDLPKEVTKEDGIKVDAIQNIELCNVSYKYKDKQQYTLKNITFSFKCEDIVILMGYNGSGKSTLMKIIMGIYHDYEGEIYINGINLKNIDKVRYREKIGVLFQDYIKYETSIMENICYGNLRNINNMSKIDVLLSKVNLTEFIHKENNNLGYQFSEGQQISIGQWQKLALARTIMKDADLYIFDEPNASLDLVSEISVLNSIYTETNKKIRIIIMHRFNNMVTKANKIVVLNNGHIEEIGNHYELLENNGIYQELYSLQNNYK